MEQKPRARLRSEASDLKVVTPTGHLCLQGDCSELCLETRKGLAVQKSLERNNETRETETQTPALPVTAV